MKTNGQISVWKNGRILYNDIFHWATVSSNLHSRHGTIDYYDSLFHGRIKDHTKIQIFKMHVRQFAITNKHSSLSAGNKWGRLWHLRSCECILCFKWN